MFVFCFVTDLFYLRSCLWDPWPVGKAYMWTYHGEWTWGAWVEYVWLTLEDGCKSMLRRRDCERYFLLWHTGERPYWARPKWLSDYPQLWWMGRWVLSLFQRISISLVVSHHFRYMNYLNCFYNISASFCSQENAGCITCLPVHNWKLLDDFEFISDGNFMPNVHIISENWSPYILQNFIPKDSLWFDKSHLSCLTRNSKLHISQPSWNLIDISQEIQCLFQ